MAIKLKDSRGRVRKAGREFLARFFRAHPRPESLAYPSGWAKFIRGNPAVRDGFRVEVKAEIANAFAAWDGTGDFVKVAQRAVGRVMLRMWRRFAAGDPDRQRAEWKKENDRRRKRYHADPAVRSRILEQAKDSRLKRKQRLKVNRYLTANGKIGRAGRAMLKRFFAEHPKPESFAHRSGFFAWYVSDFYRGESFHADAVAAVVEAVTTFVEDSPGGFLRHARRAVQAAMNAIHWNHVKQTPKLLAEHRKYQREWAANKRLKAAG